MQTGIWSERCSACSVQVPLHMIHEVCCHAAYQKLAKRGRQAGKMQNKCSTDRLTKIIDLVKIYYLLA